MGFDVTAKTRRLTNSQHTFSAILGGRLPSGGRCYTSIRFMSEQATGPQMLVVEKE